MGKHPDTGPGFGAASDTLVVKNLSYETTCEELREQLARLNLPEYVDPVMVDCKTSKGLAFVQFGSVDEASRVCRQLHNMAVQDRTVRVEFKRPDTPSKKPAARPSSALRARQMSAPLVDTPPCSGAGTAGSSGPHHTHAPIMSVSFTGAVGGPLSTHARHHLHHLDSRSSDGRSGSFSGARPAFLHHMHVQRQRQHSQSFSEPSDTDAGSSPRKPTGPVRPIPIRQPKGPDGSRGFQVARSFTHADADTADDWAPKSVA